MSQHRRGRGRGRRGLLFDLHLHSDRSDGEHAPAEVLRRCAVNGLDVVALTDHDISPGLHAGVHRVAGRELHLLHGAEVSGVHEGKELHLLVYFPGEVPDDFAGFLAERTRARAERYDLAVHNLGLDGLPPADERARAGDRAITRLHLSQALVQAGHARDLRDAFDRFTGRSHGKVPPVTLGFLEAIDLARAAGGFTSWAHPEAADVDRWAADFAAGGLQALEIYRPGVGASGRAHLLRVAHRHGLVATGGSDWHGWDKGGLGGFSFAERVARPFVEALGIQALVA